MKITRLTTMKLLVLALMSGLISSAALSQERIWKSVILAEFFTSQGCNTCPPADDFLLELDTRKEVLPIAYHVDYWDYLGWKDTFGDKKFSDRQRDYARGISSTRYYTPQVIIDGQYHLVGSHRNKVNRILHNLDHQPSSTPEISLDEETLNISWKRPPAEFDTVFFVLIDHRTHNVQINAGENRGKVIPYGNVVTDIIELSVNRSSQLGNIRWGGSVIANMGCPKDHIAALIFQQKNGKYPVQVTDTFYSTC